MPQQPPPRGSRRGLVIGVIGVAVVGLVVGTGIFAWAKLSGGGPQPADAIPSDAMAYVRLDLDPSAEQKLNAMSLLNKWPEFEEATGISDDEVDLRKLFVERVVGPGECGLDYASDIEPWIGDRLGFAIVDGKEPTPMLAVQVSDEDKAEDGASKISECVGGLGFSASTSASTIDPVSYEGEDGSDDEGANLGIAFSGDYMIVAPSQEHADDLAEDAESDSLASNNKFTSDMDALGDEGIASVWFDPKSFVDSAEEMGIPPEEVEALDDLGIGSAATALRAGDDYLELVASIDADIGATGAKADVGQLPESTMVAASISDGKSLVDDMWQQMESSMGMMGPDLQYMLSDIESTTGLSLPDDIATLFGDQMLLGVGSEGLAPDAEPSSLADFNVGIRLTSDPAELKSVVDKLTTSLGAAAGPEAVDQLYTQDTDDGMVIATNEDYASTLTDGGGGLGGSDAYKKAVPAGDDAVNVVYANLDKISSIASEDDPGTAAVLEPVEAFGFSTHVESDRTIATARLTFN